MKNVVQKEQRIKSRNGSIYQAKNHTTAKINKEKGNSVLTHADQIRSQGEYEK